MLGEAAEDIAQFFHQEERLCSVRLKSYINETLGFFKLRFAFSCPKPKNIDVQFGNKVTPTLFGGCYSGNHLQSHCEEYTEHLTDKSALILSTSDPGLDVGLTLFQDL